MNFLLKKEVIQLLLFGFGLSGDYASERLINFTGISGKLFDQDGNFFPLILLVFL